MADIVDITPDPRSAPVGDVEIRFTESTTNQPAAVTNVNIADFTLTRNLVSVDISGLSVTGSGSSYFLNLSTVTAADGAYALTLVESGSGIQDGGGQALSQDTADSWVTGPTADIVDVTPDPRHAAVGAVTINFSEAVTGVDFNDFRLSRNGVNVALTNFAVDGAGSSRTIDLSTVTSAAGNYVLTVLAAGISTVSGNRALVSNATDSWTMETTAPTADIIDVTPDPRTTAVGVVTIQFSETVTGVDLNDFELKRNGTVVDTTGAPFSGSGATYTIDLTTVTGVVGEYTLTLKSTGTNIADAAGNSLEIGASDTWALDDAIEQQNDTLRTATELGRITSPKVFAPLALVDANDWYRFTTLRAGTSADFVQIAFANTNGNLDLELYNVSGQRVRTSLTNGDTEKVSLNGLKAGTYYIRVFGKGGATNSNYSLTVNMKSPVVTRIAARPNSAVPIARSTIETDVIFSEIGTETNPRSRLSFSR